jgi:16S rRNA (cytosine1402-N4)-methyltransferase
MKLATEIDPAREPARASWPLPESALAYFPNARSASDRDLDVRAVVDLRGGLAVADEQGPYGHLPVLLERCVDLLAPALTRTAEDGSGAVLIDATLGAGGHSERFLEQFPGLRVIGLDRDPSALEIAGARLARFGDRFTAVRTRYDGIADALDECGLPARRSVAGVLFDLGVSSMQLDRTERGFSYSADAPLDMRMDPDLPLSAADILNTYDKRELTTILREYGEERFASRIAGEIVRRRAARPFTSTGELVELLYDAIPAPARRTGGHPAKRTFQALRIEVNGELAALERALPAAVSALAAGGRIAVLSYHSLEDRLVKRTLAAGARSDVPPDLPVIPPGHQPTLRLLTRGAERPAADEVAANPRAAAARLRAAERIRPREAVA